MSIKRILSIFKRDLKSSTREFLLLYMILAPLIIAAIFSFFIPSVNAISFSFAVDKALGGNVIGEFEKYGDVEVLDGRQRIEDRVKRIDDITGITIDENGEYVVVLEGNESESAKFIPGQIIKEIKNTGRADYNFELSDIGSKMSLITRYGAVSMIIFAITLGGMAIGFNIVEEKESGTVSALSASPMSRGEFIAGKSLIGIILPVVHTILILLLFGITGANLAMIVVMTLISSLLAIVLGFLIGVLSGNQIAAIANMKFLFLLVGGSIIGAIAVPTSKQFFLYWSPIYWTTVGFSKIVASEATWQHLGQYSAWILGLTLIVFVGLKNKIRKGLS